MKKKSSLKKKAKKLLVLVCLGGVGYLLAKLLKTDAAKEKLFNILGEDTYLAIEDKVYLLGDLHYLLMVTSTEDSYRYIDGMYASTAARIMHERGCIKAYELDGGQTAVITFNGIPANGIVYGAERTMSDIIYFSSAIPEEARK